MSAPHRSFRILRATDPDLDEVLRELADAICEARARQPKAATKRRPKKRSGRVISWPKPGGGAA